MDLNHDNEMVARAGLVGAIVVVGLPPSLLEPYAYPPPMPNPEPLLRSTYLAFNARDIDAALELMHPEVDWPNAWEGGRVVGHAAVRDYWSR